MNNVSVSVNIEDVKQACSNYNTLCDIVSDKVSTVLNTYQNTIIKRKLFGFIPWFNTTQFDKMKFHDKYERYGAISKLKKDVEEDIEKEYIYRSLYIITAVASDYFRYRYNHDKYRPNTYLIFLELVHTVNKLFSGYNTIVPSTISVSPVAFEFVNTYKNVEI